MVRLDALIKLIKRKMLSQEEFSDLKKDSSVSIRKTLVDYLLSEGHEIMEDAAVKNILVKPKINSGLGGLLSQNQTDTEGQVYYDEYLFTKYSSMTESQLLSLTKIFSISDDIPYLSLCSRYLKIPLKN